MQIGPPFPTRTPFRQNSLTIASSRNLMKVRAFQVAGTALMFSIGIGGTVSSGTVGGLRLANGECPRP